MEQTGKEKLQTAGLTKYKLRLIFKQIVQFESQSYPMVDVTYEHITEDIYLPDDSKVFQGARLPQLIAGEWILEKEDD